MRELIKEIRMPIREPREIFVFEYGNFLCEHRSVNSATKFLMPYAGARRFSTGRRMLSKAMRYETILFGRFSFLRGDYVYSKLVVAMNPITGDYFFKQSFGKMGEHIFGKGDPRATAKISELCSSGKLHKKSGLIFKHIDNGYVNSPATHVKEKRRLILQLNKNTEAVINGFLSVKLASEYIFDLGISSSNVLNIRTSISSCADGKNPNCNSIFGFKWRYVRHDEPAENVPLPGLDSEGL